MRGALTRRMQVPAVLSLTCRFRLKRAGPDAIEAHGDLQARVVQTCIVTLDDFEATMESGSTSASYPRARRPSQTIPRPRTKSRSKAA